MGSERKLVDIVHCRTPEMAKELFEFFISKGYSVAQSSVEIETGTHRRHVVKRLDVMSKYTAEELEAIEKEEARAATEGESGE